MSGIHCSIAGATYVAPSTVTDWSTWTNSASGTEHTINNPYTGIQVTSALAMNDQYGVYLLNNNASRGDYTLYPLSFSDTTISNSAGSSFSISTNNVNGSTFRLCPVNDTTYCFSRFNSQFTAVSFSGTTHTTGTENTIAVGNVTQFRTLQQIKNNWLLQMKTSATTTWFDLIEYDTTPDSAGSEFIARVADTTVSNFGYSQMHKLTETKFVIVGKNTSNGHAEAKLITINTGTPSVTVGSSVNVENSTAITYFFNYRHHNALKGVDRSTVIFGLPEVAQNAVGSVKFYPITESGGTLTVGTPSTIGSPDVANYTQFHTFHMYPLNEEWMMLNMIYRNNATVANRISGLMAMKVSSGAVTSTAVVTEKTTTTGALDQVYVSAAPINSTKLFRCYHDVTTDVKLRIVKHN